MKAVNIQTGERLHQVREHRNISQGHIAKSIGVTVGTVQNYEHGRVAITTDRLEQLAQALQCEPADLLASPGTPAPRYRRPRYKQIKRLALLAALTAATIGPPQFVLEFEQLANDLDRIDTDDPTQR